MFTTPLRSENTPPSEPNTSGVEKTNIDAIRDAVKTLFRFAVLERVARIPSPIPIRPAATAPQPSLRRPEEQRAEQQRADACSDCGVTSQQRDRDAEEADRRDRDVGDAEVVQVAEHVESARESGESSGDRHRANEVLLDADAAVRGSIRIEADRAHLVA